MSTPVHIRDVDRTQRIRRLEHVIQYEGHELPDFILAERFPWAKSKIIADVRKRLGIPGPDGEYLTDREMRNAVLPYQQTDPRKFGRPRGKTPTSKEHARHIAEARARRDAYADMEEEF